jgi:hypothetical protein
VRGFRKAFIPLRFSWSSVPVALFRRNAYAAAVGLFCKTVVQHLRGAANLPSPTIAKYSYRKRANKIHNIFQMVMGFID